MTDTEKNINDYRIDKLEEMMEKIIKEFSTSNKENALAIQNMAKTLSSIQVEIKEFKKSSLKVDDLEKRCNDTETDLISFKRVVNWLSFGSGLLFLLLGSWFTMYVEKTSSNIFDEKIKNYIDTTPQNININKN